MIKELVLLGNRLDRAGLQKEADLVDNLIKKVAEKGEDRFPNIDEEILESFAAELRKSKEKSGAKKFGVDLSDDQMVRFAIYSVQGITSGENLEPVTVFEASKSTPNLDKIIEKLLSAGDPENEIPVFVREPKKIGLG